MKPLYTQEEFKNCRRKDKLPLQCLNCNNTFYKSKKRIIQNTKEIREFSGAGSFCCKSCSDKHKSCLHRVDKVCFLCSKSINILLKECKDKNFCSRSCSAKYFNSFRKKPVTHKQSKKELNICNCCGSLTKNRLYCTDLCRNKYMHLTPKPKRIKQIKVPNKCLHCKKDTFNPKYCSGTCRNNALNKYKNGSKSKAEKVLCEKIKLNFPQWNILENNRTILDGLELDIYIPHLKLAIEWNGIFHLEPIRGQEVLQKIINKDNRKQELCKEKGISLLVISDRTSHKKFIEETTNKLIEKLKLIENAELHGIEP